MNTKQLLQEEIASAMAELKKTKVGTDEYKAIVESITKLTDKLVELEKLDVETDKIQTDYEIEHEKNQIERVKVENEKADNRLKNVLSALGIVVPAGLTIWGTFKSIKFEETGTITTIAGRNFFNKLFKK